MLSLFRRLSLVMFLACGAAALSGCGGGDDEPAPMPTVVELAQGDPNFSVLVEAVQAADLVAALSGAGPYTVFAPTNDAFAALLNELQISKAQLLADKPLLTAVLQYHVLTAAVPSGQVPLGKPVTPLAGGYFKVEAAGTGLAITDGRNRVSQVVKADLKARNGVVHAIGKVLLPADKNLVQTAQALASGTPAEFTVLVEALQAADLAAALAGTGPFTVFAPTDAAFADLLGELGVTKQQLLADKALLTKVLTYHVVSGLTLKADVPVGTPITSVEGETFTVDGTLSITDRRNRSSRIVSTDVLSSNGVIHVIDKVILPAP